MSQLSEMLFEKLPSIIASYLAPIIRICCSIITDVGLYIFIKPGGNILTTQARNHPRGTRRRPTTTRRRQNHSGENYFDSIELEKLPDLGNLGKKTNDELRQLAIDTGIKRVPTQRNELVLTILSSCLMRKRQSWELGY